MISYPRTITSRGADSYTLSITFPIKGCAENIAIFGHIYRKDFNFGTDKVTMDFAFFATAFNIKKMIAKKKRAA